jgi:fructokinase
MQFDISAFGEILIDFTFSGRNEDGVALFAQNPGGAPGNVVVAAQKLGSKTAYLGKAGDDMHGRFLKDVLNEQNVNTDGMILSDKFFTTLAFVNLNEQGERTFSFARKPGADTQMSEDDFNIDIVKNSKIFHVGSLSLTDEPARSTTLYAIKEAKKAGVIISYDPNYRDSLWPNEFVAMDAMRSLVPYVDLMKISDEETVLLTGNEEPKAAAALLHQKGVKVVVVTLGADGALVSNKEGSVIVPGFKSHCIDTTGAGDSFWAGFLHTVANLNKKPEELTLEELANAARVGNAVASLCVEGKGAIPAMPSLEQVQERLSK